MYNDPMFLSFPTDDDLVNYLVHDLPVTTPFGGCIPARGNRKPPLIIVYGNVHFDSVVPGVGGLPRPLVPLSTESPPGLQPLGSDGNVELCSACAEGGDLVCCDNCPAAYHRECAELPSIPEGHWFCHDCSAPGPSTRPAAPSHARTHRAGPADKPFKCKANGCLCSFPTLALLGRHINGVRQRAPSAAHTECILLGPEAYGLISCPRCSRWCKQAGLTKHRNGCDGFSPPPMPSNAARRLNASPPPPDHPDGSVGSPPSRPYTLVGKAHAALACWAQSSNPLEFIITHQLQTKCNFKVETETTAGLFVDIVDGLIAAEDDPAAEALLFFLPYLLWTPCEGDPKRVRKVVQRRIERFCEGDLEGLLSDACFLRNTKAAQKPTSTTTSKSDETRFRLASHLVQVGAISRGNQQLVSKGMLEDHGPCEPGGESDLQRRVRSKFPAEPHRATIAEISGPFPAFRITADDLRSDEGPFGPRMPRMKAAGLDGWRLEHVAQLVMNSEAAAAGFGRLIAWITSDHAPGKGPSPRFMAFYGTMRVLPFRKELLSPDPRPVVVPSGLCRAIERALDTKFRAAYVRASGPFQFGYNAPAGTEQAVQLVRLAREVLDSPVTVLWDASNAFPTCSNSDTLEALAQDDELKALVPYFTRCFGTAASRAAGHLPEILYYGAGRGGNGPCGPTMRLAKLDGLGQGTVTSTGNYNITANRALQALRRDTQHDGIMSAFIDDLTTVYPASTALDQFDRTLAASEEGTGNKMNWDKIKVILPPPRNDTDRGIIATLTAGFLCRGVKLANIISDDTPSAERGAKLLGAPIGHPDFAEALVRKRGRQLEENSMMVGAMGASHPYEALQILNKALSKRMDHAASQNVPTCGVIDALQTADNAMHAVLGKLCGELSSLEPGVDVAMPPFARAVAGMAPSWGGLNIRPLARLASTGTLHLSSLNRALPRLLERLDTTDAGDAAKAIAAEIRSVDTSLLPWAVSARAAYADLQAVIGQPMAQADVAMLKKLFPAVPDMCKPIALPTLLSLATALHKPLQHEISQAIWQRDFVALLRRSSPYEKFLLRSGCAKGASLHLELMDLDPFAPSHLAGSDRMQPHIFRMALRYVLGLEPIQGYAASVMATGGCCPTCRNDLRGYSVQIITNHTVSCGTGKQTQKVASALTDALQRNFWELGVSSEREAIGLSRTSAHRPGDAVSEDMSVPQSFDCGGQHRVCVDTCVSYLNPTNIALVNNDDPEAAVAKAEEDKWAKIEREVQEGLRSALPDGYTFLAACADSRGRFGPGMQRILSWMAEYGSRHQRFTGSDATAKVDAKLLARFRARVAVALHRGLMHAYLNRAQKVAKREHLVTGRTPVDALGLRWQGLGRAR